MGTIQRTKKQVQLLSYGSTTDDYGQLRTDTATSADIEMAVYPYSQNEVSDPRCVDAQLIGLTKADVKVSNRVVVDGVEYDVIHVNPGRQNAVFMRVHG